MMSHDYDQMLLHTMTLRRVSFLCMIGAFCLSLLSFACSARHVAGGAPSRDKTVNAGTCEFDAVRAAVGAARSGDTVVIPAGDCNWQQRQLDVPANVHLRGAGRDVTTIRRSGKLPNSIFLIAFDCSKGGTVKFTGISLIGNGDGDMQDKGLGLLHGCVDFIVSQSRFRNFIFSAVYVGDSETQRGVIYGNDFIDNYGPALGNLGYGVVVYGGGTWPTLSWGTENAVFVEDNYFSGNRHNIASNNGSVYVFRHNTVVGTDPAKDFAMTDAHGLSSSPRGSRSYEIYDNHYSGKLTHGLQRSAIGIRGGDGLIFNNVVTAHISRAIELSAEGFACGTYPGQDQIRSLYIWNNSFQGMNSRFEGGIDNECPDSIKLNRDYFLNTKPGYLPYAYPHPLRAT